MMEFLSAALLLASAPAASAECVVTGATTAVDVRRAERACEIARTRFRALFGQGAPALEIVLREQPGYRVSDTGQGARVYWPTSAALARVRSAMSPEQQWRDVLPHEAMHALLASHFFHGHDHLGAPYGTPFADWFEEAVAIWAEPAASRRHRLAQARNLPAPLRELPAILETAHPAAREPALLAARDGAPLPADDIALWAFYPQAIAVLSFVYDHGGPAAVAMLAARLLEGAPHGTVLAGLPGLPTDGSGVLTAWSRWLPESAQSRALADAPEP